MHTLVALSYSPWSEKARWAMDHHGLGYREKAYSPLFGAPILRLRTGKFTGQVTVPTLFYGQGYLMDSFEIAKYADRVGRGEALIPEGSARQIEGWNRESERALSAGRALLIHNISGDAKAKEEYVPRLVPGFLRPLLAPMVARVGLGYFTRKYGLKALPPQHCLAVIREVLSKMRKILGGDSPYLCGRFSFADIAMAMVFQVVEPVSSEFIRIGSRSRPSWANPELAEEFPDLVAWRDELYRKERRRNR